MQPTLPYHPFANKFPLLLGDEFKEFVADIKAHDLREPITLYKGEILDGRNRYRACLRLKLKPRFEEFTGDDDAAPAFVISKNIARRHLKPKDKREAIAALLKANPERSNNAIAKIAKVNDKTVGAVRTDLERRSEIPNVKTRTDSKGRKQPAQKAGKARKIDTAKSVPLPADNASAPETSAGKMKAEFAAMEAAGESTTTKANKRDREQPATTTAAAEVAARDPALHDELTLLRKFARFIIGRAGVSVNPKDYAEWKALFDKIKATLGVAP